MNLSKKAIKISVIGCVISIFLGAGSYVLYHSYSAQGIYEYNQQRDSAFIKQLFHEDWYWLVAGVSDTFDETAQYYVDYILKYRSNSLTLPPKHILTMKVGYEGDQPTGFLAYYVKKFYLGKILFVDVLPAYRSKGWGVKFVKYALRDLINHGVSQVELVTRTDNAAAQALYRKLGFQEKGQDEGFVKFTYDVP
jgi:ribosomal protein S18 acetylase RimI-like enzyme